VIYLIPLTLFLVLINLLSRYISNFRRIAVPAIFDQLTIKVTLPLIILLYISGWLTAEGVMIAIVASFAFSVLGMIFYLRYLGEWRLTKPIILKDKAGLVEFSRYSWYGLLTGIGSQVAFRIDTLMVTNMIQLQATGVYAISWALSEVISKPMRSLTSIAGPLLADQIENNKMEEVKTMYQKSSLTMTIIGLGLFLLIWTVLPFIFQIMPNTEVMQQGMYVVFFLGLAQVWDMMTGVNNEIISYSRYYRFNLILTLFLAIINIGANLIFIPLYGLMGSALATCLSMFLYNLAKLVFIYWRFGFHPFTPRIIPTFGFGLAAWMIATALPESANHFFNLMYKGAVFSLLFGLSIWKFKISPDINHWIELAWLKIASLLGKDKG
jgi:O-antigen/teichoic acid export membrane protein